MSDFLGFRLFQHPAWKLVLLQNCLDFVLHDVAPCNHTRLAFCCSLMAPAPRTALTPLIFPLSLFIVTCFVVDLDILHQSTLCCSIIAPAPRTTCSKKPLYSVRTNCTLQIMSNVSQQVLLLSFAEPVDGLVIGDSLALLPACRPSSCWVL